MYKSISREIFSSLSIGFASLEPVLDTKENIIDCIVLEVNDDMLKLIGKEGTDTIGQEFTKVIADIDLNLRPFIAGFKESLNKGVDFSEKTLNNGEWINISTYYINGVIYVIAENITYQISVANDLKDIVEMTEEFYALSKDSYQKVADKLRKISNSKVVFLNLRDHSNHISRIETISAEEKVIEKIKHVLGEENIFKYWKSIPKYVSLLMKQKYLKFSSVDEFFSMFVIEETRRVVGRYFKDFGEVVILSILNENDLIGDFILIRGKGKPCQKLQIGKIFAKQFSSAYMNALAKKRISHQQELLEHIIKHSPSDVYVLDKDLRYIYASKRYLERDPDIIGKKYFDISKHVGNSTETIFKGLLSGEIECSKKDPYIRNNGTVDWTCWESRPWIDEFGGIGGIIVYSDILREKKHIEDDLKISNQKFNIIFRHSKIPMMYFDASGNLKNVNDACYDLFGIDKSYSFDHLNLFDSPFITNEVEEVLKKEGTIEFDSENNMELLDGYQMGESSVKENRTITRYITKIIEDGKCLGYVEQLQDITEKKKYQRKLEYIARHDTLTDLYNKDYFLSKIEQLQEDEVLPLTIIIGNINGLKMINKSFGYAAGTNVIKNIAHAIKKACRVQEFIARISGDEFAIVLEKVNEQDASHIIKRIYNACKENHSKKTEQLEPSCTISFGLATRESIKMSVDEVVSVAFERMNNHRILDSKSSHNAILSTILATMNERCLETKEHSERMAVYAGKIGEQMKLSTLEMDQLRLTATLHDIGKISVDDAVLNKKGKLNDDEWVEMKKHCDAGYRIAIANPELTNIAEYILCHHERFDGSGYPNKLKGKKIPLISRIVSIVDAYDAMTEDRPYRKALSHMDAVQEIKRCSGSQFDPELVEVFLRIDKNS